MSPDAARPGPKDAGLRILVVDDDEDIRGVLSDVLESEGFHVTVAPGGYDAITALESAAFDVILLDQQMPDFGGAALLRLIRGAPGPDRVPVVVVSALPVAESMRTLADGFLEKPFDIDVLVRLVRRVVHAAST